MGGAAWVSDAVAVDAEVGRPKQFVPSSAMSVSVNGPVFALSCLAGGACFSHALDPGIASTVSLYGTGVRLISA